MGAAPRDWSAGAARRGREGEREGICGGYMWRERSQRSASTRGAGTEGWALAVSGRAAQAAARDAHPSVATAATPRWRQPLRVSVSAAALAGPSHAVLCDQAGRCGDGGGGGGESQRRGLPQPGEGLRCALHPAAGRQRVTGGRWAAETGGA